MLKPYSILIIDTYYSAFLQSIYSNQPELASKGYYEQHRLIMEQFFGTANSYSKHLKKLGCEAEEVIPNNEILQKQWAKENGLRVGDKSLIKSIVGRMPYVKRLVSTGSWSFEVLEAQIKKLKPDVLYIQDLSFCPPDFLQRMKKLVKLIIGQIACPLPPTNYLRPYDLILTSFPHYVERFRAMGISSEYFRIGFEPDVLAKVGPQERIYECTFVGGISRAHNKGTILLEELARRTDIQFFGYGADSLEENSPILSRHHGEVWGREMYKVLLQSKITINRHIDVAEDYANNMRLYEATGCGALLLTDDKKNLNELFEVGQEVVAYRDVDELVELINNYKENQEDREKIAKAGQRRTLSEHSYSSRMEDLVEVIGKYIN